MKNATPFPEFFEQSPIILGEGAGIERLRRNTDFELDPFIVNSAFIYDKEKRADLETIYRQYLDIGFQYDLPLLLSTPTWRASRNLITAAGAVEGSPGGWGEDGGTSAWSAGGGGGHGGTGGDAGGNYGGRGGSTRSP